MKDSPTCGDALSTQKLSGGGVEVCDGGGGKGGLGYD